MIRKRKKETEEKKKKEREREKSTNPLPSHFRVSSLTSSIQIESIYIHTHIYHRRTLIISNIFLRSTVPRRNDKNFSDEKEEIEYDENGVEEIEIYSSEITTKTHINTD